ncbi:hypothetical protein [Secundilactobacillus collinoides]|uniref:Uncharacterized protein n=1 Tax=Secundilactobacillus collinoides DSM 20515 = JCM 1123 TaxID=1423733 RepID=A0A0R2B514_SECCO|nr:hypothetical protein [Secundilactobacillus collinoides]KRM74263.1 hypothetical protein FC82_GL000262 [Secundilactobacillus collinoides DSM 20515 = JCM 1123]
MNALDQYNNNQPHTDYDNVRPIMLKDLQNISAAEREFFQAHAFGMEPKTNHFYS